MHRARLLLAAIPLAALCFAAAGDAAPAPGSADLAISKSASAASVTVGSTLTFAIKAENRGPDPATGVTVTDPLPKGVDYVSSTSTAGQCGLQGQKVVCAIGNLAAGAGSDISLVVIPRKDGSISNTASIKGDQGDPVGSNDTATAAVRVLPVAKQASCRGFAASVVGTAGADQLVGTAGRDVVVGLGGGDTVSTLAGRDLVCAGAGSDVVTAGAGADRVFGNAGGDRLSGRGGPDVLRGGLGFDRCRGGAGSDSIRGCER